MKRGTDITANPTPQLSNQEENLTLAKNGERQKNQFASEIIWHQTTTPTTVTTTTTTATQITATTKNYKGK